MDDVWRRLGLDPVPLARRREASGSSSRADWDWPEGLKESLQVMYRPQVARLETDWGLDLTDWTATLRPEGGSHARERPRPRRSARTVRRAAARGTLPRAADLGGASGSAT